MQCKIPKPRIVLKLDVCALFFVVLYQLFDRVTAFPLIKAFLLMVAVLC